MTEIAQHISELKDLKAAVVVLSFNPDLETAQRWDKEVQSPFLQVFDPAVPGTPGDAGTTYLSWGLKKSFIGVWSPASLRFYSDQKMNRELHPSLGQDVHRMGGDILLDSEGRVVLDHYSKTNTDRPDVEKTLLPLMRALHVQSQQCGSSKVKQGSGTAASAVPAWEQAANSDMKPVQQKQDCKS